MALNHDVRRQLVVLHLALCLGCGLFILVTLALLLLKELPIAPDLGPEAPWLGVAVAAVAVPSAYGILRAMLVRLGEDYETGALAQRVRSAAIAHWALLELAVMANTVLFLLTGSWTSLVLAVALLGLLVGRKPSPERYQRWCVGSA